MHPTPRTSSKSRLRGALLAIALMVAPAAYAGPPTLCYPFNTAGAASLPWGSGRGWNTPDRAYDTHRLLADTQSLLVPRTPVIARMETLRRAAIYASADGATLLGIAAMLDARIAASKDADHKALALFDAGYFAETLQDIIRLQGYDMPGIGKVDKRALNAVQARGDGSLRIAQALKLRPDDASMRFAAALVSSSDQRKADFAVHARLARAGADGDRLLALNIGHISH